MRPLPSPPNDHTLPRRLWGRAKVEAYLDRGYSARRVAELSAWSWLDVIEVKKELGK